MVFLSFTKLVRGWRVLVWKTVRALSNQRLPYQKKSDVKTYQNTKICYERGNMKEDSARRSLPAHYMLEDFREDFPKVFQIWLISEKLANPKSFKWLQNRENEIDLPLLNTQKYINIKIYRYTFKGVENEKRIIKNPQKQDKLVRNTWDKKNEKLI